MATNGLDPLVFGTEPRINGADRCWFCGGRGICLTDLGEVCETCLAPRVAAEWRPDSNREG